MTQLDTDIYYMRRCLQIASGGEGLVRPNPMVGCVVVGDDGTIISEGFHQQYGKNHAERNALINLSGDVAKGSTLYVNLEPCSHFGKTPPCADLIVERGVRRVVCCNDDPNPLVAGQGFEKLKRAGISVTKHILEEEGRELNRRFFTFIEKKRPYIILKWAETTDGFMAPAVDGRNSYWISNKMQTIMSHKMRTRENAILIGSQTFIDDKPQLTARLYVGNQPRPIVLDRRGRIKEIPSHWLHLGGQNPGEIMDLLYENKIQSVIVEGGRTILDSFIAAGLYDEVVVFRGKSLFADGLKAPQIPPLPQERIHIYC